MTRHDEDIVDLRTLQAISREFGLFRNLRIILVEVLGEIDDGLFDKLQITCTTHDDTHRHRIVGLGLRLSELGRDIKLSYATREIRWARG